ITYYPTTGGDIIVHVLDRCGSEAVDTAHVGLFPLPPISFFSDITEGCQPLTVQFNEQSPDLGQSYLWDFGDNNNLSFAKNPTHVFDDYGVFDVTLMVTSAQGCTNQFTFEDMITVYKKPHAQFTTFPEVVTVLNSMVQFNNISQDNVLNYWYFGDGDSSLVESPAHQYPSFSGTYDVSLIVESQDGCLDTALENLTVNDVYTFWAPTAFSPDNDQLNDMFFVTGYGIDTLDFHLYIYDRFGEIIFQTEKFDAITHKSEVWNGTCKNHKVGQNGSYTWLCIFNDVFGKAHQETGRITLYR
ncbi:MAG: gliding motility-associated C-terminal domain-containing protein, partial [Bacteroidales bacterium]|nr:gliding motility-associated C-terminal domain-containing protein [Bacteroidales bacterium]